jgi:hypothetical protein
VSSPVTLEAISRFYEIQLGGLSIEGDLDVIFFNPVALTSPKWRTFELLRWMNTLHSEMAEDMFKERVKALKAHQRSLIKTSTQPWRRAVYCVCVRMCVCDVMC